MVEMLKTPVEGPSVWRGEGLQNSDEWIYHFTEGDLSEFERALDAVRGRPVAEFGPQDFRLPTFDKRIEEFLHEIDYGRGFQLLRGLPIHDRFDEEESTKLYEALCCRLGVRIPTVRSGDLLNSVRDLGPELDPNGRSYATAWFWEPHTDITDIVTLMCLRPSLHGGQSNVTSSMTMYNTLLEEHPEWLPILYKVFPIDWRNEEPEGSPGYWTQPLYCYEDGWLSGGMRTTWIRHAQRFADVPRLSAEEIACFQYLEELTTRPGMTLSMTLQTGDIQILNNFTVMHDRNLMLDARQDLTHQRHMLRCWISRSGIGPRVVSADFEFLRRDYYGLESRPPAESYRAIWAEAACQAAEAPERSAAVA